MADINKTMDTVEAFFLVATENSTSMSKKCINDVLGIITWVKGRHRRIDRLERDLMEGVSLANATWDGGKEAAVKLTAWANKARMWKAVHAQVENLEGKVEETLFDAYRLPDPIPLTPGCPHGVIEIFHGGDHDCQVCENHREDDADNV